MKFAGVVCSALIFILVGCSTQSSTRGELPAVSRSSRGIIVVNAPTTPLLIKQGDNIDLSVWGYPEFTTSATVKTGGTITIPLVGEIKAAGLTKDDFSELVRARLSEYVQGQPKITISISSPLVQKVTVLGAVTRQDNYPVTAEVPLVEVLSTAGGTTVDSDLNHVRILRYGSDEPIEVDVQHFIETGNVELIPKVRPGDTIYVPKKENFIRSFSDFLRDVVVLFGFFRVL
ncbi:MAG TPA: polysaccharide biosynthesis/export family protein, partial [Bacteroidota bacterium]